MKKNKIKMLIAGGIFCILMMFFASWHAITFNGSRLVVPMDFESYTFQIKDLPMIISIFLTCSYVVSLFVVLFINIGKRQKEVVQTNTTRKINPKWGFLGLMGFLGFLGFWTYPINGDVFPFVFFMCFGFFGFFYEGKMAGTFMDERFQENVVQAQVKSYKITFSIMFITLIILCQGRFFGSLEYTFIATIIVLSLTLALGIFLPEYLLYRYDHDEQANESEE